MTEHEWKVDDEVIVWGFSIGGRDSRSVGRVQKVTATQLVVMVGAAQYRFAKRGLREIGGSQWHFKWIKLAAPDEIEAVRRESARSSRIARLRHTKWDTMPDDLLRDVCAVLDAGTDSAPEGA